MYFKYVLVAMEFYLILIRFASARAAQALGLCCCTWALSLQANVNISCFTGSVARGSCT